jgi:uncharacterized membrane protein YedE/YeeE
MSLPLFEYGAFGDAGALGVALFVGMAFGWTLERAGLGSAPKLAGQFLLTDLTVFKVMFTAVVTAMLGAFWLGRVGVLDLARVYVPETFLLPQLVGGVVFGLGFFLSGLCPGTSCVSAASGRLDGLSVVAGMFAGVLFTGVAFAWIRPLYDATPWGTVTLTGWLGLPYGVVVCAVVLLAVGGCMVAERLEARAR